MKHFFEKNFISILMALLMLFGSVFGSATVAFAEEASPADEVAETDFSAATEPAEEEVPSDPASEREQEATEPVEVPDPASAEEKPTEEATQPETPLTTAEETGTGENKETTKKDEQKKDEQKKVKKQEAPAEKDEPYSAPWLSSSDIPVDDDTLMVLITFFREELRLNKAALAGFLANIHRESAYDYVKVGDYGNAFGLCQWRSDRLDMLVAYCDENELNPVTLEGQLAYLLYEIQEYYPNLCIYFECCEETVDDAAWSAYYVCRAYEVPTDLDEECEIREEYAREIYYPKILELEEQGLLPPIPEE